MIDEVEQALRHWGRMNMQRDPLEDRSPIACPMGKVAGRKPREGRTDLAFRRAPLPRMQALDECGKPRTEARPYWCMDSMPCTETRTPKLFDPHTGPVYDQDSDPVADAIEQHVQDMYRLEPVWALCMRLEYCVRGMRQREKVERVNAQLAESRLQDRLTLRRYRLALEAARVWMYGRMTVRRSA